MSYIDDKRAWLEKHQDATLEEAFEAGYWLSCDNWCKRKR